LSKFEKVFKAIKKKQQKLQFFLKKYNFKKPKRETGTSEHVGSIFISDTKKN
jgi:hypothetical protein